jgi:hypothetical protein
MVVGWATLSKTGSKVQYTCAGCGQWVVEGSASYYYMPWIPLYVSPQIHCTLFFYVLAPPPSWWRSEFSHTHPFFLVPVATLRHLNASTVYGHILLRACACVRRRDSLCRTLAVTRTAWVTSQEAGAISTSSPPSPRLPPLPTGNKLARQCALQSQNDLLTSSALSPGPSASCRSATRAPPLTPRRCWQP